MTSTSPMMMFDAERKQLNQASGVIDRLLNFRRPYDSQRDELYRHYIGRPIQRFFPDKKTKRASVFVPYPNANVQQVRATVLAALFSQDPCFESLPRGNSDSDSALAMQRVLDYKLVQKAHLRDTLDEFVGGMAIYGFHALGVGWDFDYDIVASRQIAPVMHPDGSQATHPLMPDQPMMAAQWVRNKVPRMRPKLETIDIYDILIDPDGAFIAKLFNKTFPQMVREQAVAAQMGVHLYADDALGRIDQQLAREPNRDHQLIHIAELWDAVNGTCTSLTIPEDPTSLRFKDMRYANRAQMYQTFRRETASTVQTMLLSPTYDNPYNHCQVPILCANYIKNPGEIFGMGIIEPAFAINEALNTNLGMLQDNQNLGVNQRLVVSDSRDIDFESLQGNNVPGGIIVVQGDASNAVFPLPVHTPQAGDYNILGIYKDQIAVVAGQADFYSRGVGSSGGNDTASGINSVIQQASKRDVDVVRRLEENVMEPIFQMCAANCQQFLTDDVEVRITDERPAIGKLNSQTLKIAPEEILGSFDFKFHGSIYMQNIFVQQRNIDALTNLVATNPGMAQFIKPYPALQELFRIHQVAYPGRFLKTEAEVQAEQQAAQMQEMQQQIALAQTLKDRGLTHEHLSANAKAQSERGGPNRPKPKGTSGEATSAARSFSQVNGSNSPSLGGASGT